MLGIRSPDRHALPPVTPSKRADRDRCSLPRERVRSIGATSSLPVALAKGCSQSTLPTFVIERCRSAVCGVHDLRPGKPPEGELDGSEGHEGGQSFRKVLEVLGETPVASEPGERALDHPAAW